MANIIGNNLYIKLNMFSASAAVSINNNNQESISKQTPPERVFLVTLNELANLSNLHYFRCDLFVQIPIIIYKMGTWP